MSENNEHPPDDNEAETKTIEDLPNDSSKSEMKLMNRTEMTMLEDEEMPTYISVSSTSRRDDSDVVNAKQQENISQEMEEDCSPSPYPSDDQAASSVYVLSSEEDTDQHPYNDEDDEDEYGDSDDMENLELDNDMDTEDPNNMRHLMDEEDDDEDDENEKDDEKDFRQIYSNDDGTFDDNFELHYDGRSDDFLLNRRIKNRDKEKSLSLQDLNMSKKKIEYMQRKYSHRQYAPCKQLVKIDPETYPILFRKQPTLEMYDHVTSKVKFYIEDIKEQNRRSLEKYMKQSQEDTKHSKSNTNHKNSDIKEIKAIVTNKTIKDYAKRTIKELEIAEACEGDKIIYNTSPLILNGQDNKNYLESIQEESTQNEKNLLNMDKMQKQNGTVEDKQLKLSVPDGEVAHYGNAMQPSLVSNDHQEEPTVLFNLRTLSSEEFKHDISNSSQKINLNKNAHVTEQEHNQPETYNNAELMDVSVDNHDTTCSLKIENIKSIKTMADEAKNNNEQVRSNKVNEFSKTLPDSLEITTLKDQLDDVIQKKERLYNAFREQVIENLLLKSTIEQLSVSLAKYVAKEQKVASVQTDDIDITPVKHQISIQTDIDEPEKHHKETESTHIKSNNKILGSSVASTLSSIEWSDSACNLSVSMKPPEVVKALHSDDSIVLTNGTAAKTTRSLSRTFITSSRILQTLSNITQGKTKLESPLVQNSKRRLSENVMLELQNDDSRCQIVNGSCRPSSSKKRKIADILEPSNSLPCQTTESHPKLNDMHDSQFKHPCNSVNEKVESQQNSSNSNTSRLETASMTENITENADDQEDNVKCFVYHENENSKDHSFLIIAKEPTKDKTVSEKRREGGPYIVGNIEVRMSEINGTINIWGKEISQESIAETENEIETSTKGIDDKKYHCWQKTPHTKFNGSNLVCSTSKKCKTPPAFDFSSAVSNFSCTHSPSFNMAKASCSTDKTHVDNLLSPNACVSSCEDCELSKDRKEWLRYKQTHSQEKLHSCCIHNVDMLEQNCSLHKEKQKFEDNFNRSKQKLSTKEHRRSFSRNLEPNKHLHKNIVNSVTEVPTCKCHTACHDTLHDSGEICQENYKCYNTLKETCTCEPLSMNTNREYNESCNYLSPNVHEEEPLIALKYNETPETRRRRLSGKRVRGILKDLLRGCGDCYNSNSSNNKSCIHRKESCLTNGSSQNKISPCASPEPSCSNLGQPVGRCCHAYAQRIESQLEEFRVEMERVRSRSDAILNMLNMLHSDTN
ncbi:MATH and LRR domain-containing protein PFE0570w-like [Cataglyphis hispanica]|uniref:MATH and LRR domain-containing protein PFE0570w-like n=1 Tax=Cataglyphis hispanica TaxID=1086592 RepID=UPI002180317C|nr:MATH and LRR domain-containing protein PFE0570w-like [Cataglyphis hispanica]